MKKGITLILLLVLMMNINSVLADEGPILTELKSVKAIGNITLEASFELKENESISKDISLYKIENLKINKISLINENTIHIETKAMIKDKEYTLQYNNKEYSFKGIAKITGEPYITSIKSNGDNTLDISFSRTMDFVTATNPDNYSIIGTKILGIKYNGRSVTLTLSELLPNRNYNMTITKLKSIDKITITRVKKKYFNLVDLTPPKLDEVKIENNIRLALYFDEALDSNTAQNVDNYRIDSSQGELKVVKASLSGSKNNIVKLTTETQGAGVKYTLVIKDIQDRAKVKNIIKKPIEKVLYGAKPDTIKPTLKSSDTEIVSKNEIRVTFKDNNELDEKAILFMDNYEIAESSGDKNIIAVEKVKKISYSDKEYKVSLTVSDLEPRKSYNLYAYNIVDEFGNELQNSNITIRMSPELAASAKIKSFNVANNSRLEITFTKALDKEYAEDTSLYEISKDIYSPNKAAYRANKVILDIEPLEEKETYTIEIDGLLDIAGNEITLSRNFTSKEEAPFVLYFYKSDENTFSLYMSEDLTILKSSVIMGGQVFKVSLDKEDKALALFSSNSAIDEEKEYSLDLASVISDKKGIKAKNKSYLITVLQEGMYEYVDREAPYIINIQVVEPNIVEICYSEDIKTTGRYTIEYIEDDKIEYLTIDSYEIKGSQVILELNEDTIIKEGIEYVLKIDSQAKDMAGNVSDNEVDEELIIQDRL